MHRSGYSDLSVNGNLRGLLAGIATKNIPLVLYFCSVFQALCPIYRQLFSTWHPEGGLLSPILLKRMILAVVYFIIIVSIFVIQCRYKENLKTNNKTGRGKCVWQYFEKMDELMKNDPAINPPRMLSSLPSAATDTKATTRSCQQPVNQCKILLYFIIC